MLLSDHRIGGLPETQEMLDFCATHRIACDLELTNIQGVNEAYERVHRGNVRYWFVIDMDSLRRSLSRPP